MAFRFAIGDIVIGRTAIDDCYLSARVGWLRIPNHFMVLEQLTMTGNGITEEWYMLSRDGERRKYREDEVASLGDFDLNHALTLCDNYFLLRPNEQHRRDNPPRPPHWDDA